jgi:hypothetical protein
VLFLPTHYWQSGRQWRERGEVEPWKVVVDEKSDRDNVGFAATEAAEVAFHATRLTAASSSHLSLGNIRLII